MKNLCIERVDSWYTDENISGAKILTMPNIPRPLHGRNPRTIMGSAGWDAMRTSCYKKAKYTCEACGKKLLHPQAHELYSISYVEGTQKFIRCVCLCDLCHKGVHSGHAVTDYLNGKITKEELFDIVENVFRLVSEHNELNKNSKPLKVYAAFLRCLKIPELRDDVSALIEEYNIEFYKERISRSASWSDWHLVFGNALFGPLYKTYSDWFNSRGSGRKLRSYVIFSNNYAMRVA